MANKKSDSTIKNSELYFLFENMIDGYALHEMIYNDKGEPVDYRFIDVNPSFELITGLKSKDILGKRVLEILPQTEPYWIEKYNEALVGNRPVEFSNYAANLNKYFNVKAYKTGEGRFALTFQDITENKKYETELGILVNLLQLVNSNTNLHELIRESVKLFREFTHCEAVGIRLKEGEDYPYFEQAGFPESFVKKENSLCSRDNNGNVLLDGEGNPLLDCMCGNIIRSRFDPQYNFFTPHGSFWSNGTSELLASTSEEDRQANTRNYCNGRGYESVALLPLKAGSETFGLLQLNDKHTGRFNLKEIEFLEHLSDNLALGLANRKADKALAENEKKYRTLFESNLIGVFYLDKNGKCIDVNESALKMLGMTKEEFLGGLFFDISYPLIDKNGEFISTERNPSYLPFKTGKPIYNYEIGAFNRTKNEVAWLLLNAVPEFHDGNDKLFRTAITLTDITDRKKTEQALVESEAAAMALLNATTDSVFMMKPDGTLITVNQEFASRLNKPTEMIVGNNIYEVLPKEVAKTRFQKINEVIASGTPARFIDERNDRIIDNSIYPVYDSFANIICAAVYGKDITESRRAHEELKSSEEKYRRIVETANEGIWLMDGNFNITFVNSKMVEILGYEEEEIIGKNILYFLFEEDLEDHKEKMNERLSGNNQLYERRFKKKDGTEVWTLVSATPLSSEEDQFEGSFSMFTDITARKTAEESIKLSLREKELLLKEVHHRVKNNFQLISSLISLQADVTDNNAIIEMSNDIQSRIKSMSLIHEMMYSSGNFIDIDLGTYVNRLVEYLNSSYTNANGDVALKADIETIEINLDELLPIGLILNELVANSLKHAFPNKAKGQIDIIIKNINTSMLKIIVKDNGCGLPKDFQMKNVKSLGLFLVQTLITQLGGEYSYASPVEGTEIDISIPYNKKGK